MAKAPLGTKGLASGPLVSRADASSIPRMLGRPWPRLCQAGRRAGAVLGGPDFLHLPVPMPSFCPPGAGGGGWLVSGPSNTFPSCVSRLHLVNPSPTLLGIYNFAMML